MTLELFEKAQEIRDEIEIVLDVESLLLNWKIEDGPSNILKTIYGSDSPNYGKTINTVFRCSKELQDRLVQTCRDYYYELNKQFDEI